MNGTYHNDAGHEQGTRCHIIIVYDPVSKPAHQRVAARVHIGSCWVVPRCWLRARGFAKVTEKSNRRCDNETQVSDDAPDVHELPPEVLCPIHYER